jgi:phosphoglucosamine mutase
MLFGTDGIRGTANAYPMTSETILALARAATLHFMKLEQHDYRFTVVIGKDTRRSGYMIETALVSGFVSMGADVMLLGPIPTPGVSMLTHSLRAHLGVMISASHNPAEDNGIKFFASDGNKIKDHDEQAIEHFLTQDITLVDAKDLGCAQRLDDALGRYTEFVKATFPKKCRLDGFKIVVDCAHGAAYKVAPRILWELGAEVSSIGTDPDGTNINKNVGATSPRNLQCKVLESHADIGIALDGDADRLILVDERGQVIDGDQILATIATQWHNKGIIRGGVVATCVSNLGLDRYLNQLGVELYRSKVGDRHVLEMMAEKGCNIGGEQSGHIVLNDFVSTGDGLIAALQVLSLMKEVGFKASQISSLFTPVPQISKNIRLDTKISLNHYPDLQGEIESIQNQFDGELIVRASGTEPLIRIVAQGDDEIILNKTVEDVQKMIHKQMNI